MSLTSQTETTVRSELADRGSPIENEITSYRAISSLAVTSLIFGLLSFLCFASVTFQLFALLAVFFGFLGLRSVRRYPELITGSGLARAGIMLGIICGLSAITITTVQSQMRVSEARKFAEMYLQVVKDGSLAQNAWYRLDPEARANTKPENMPETMTTPGPDGRSTFEMFTTPVAAIKEKLGSAPTANLRLDKIERHGVEGLTPWASVLLRVEGLPDHEHKQGESEHDHEAEEAKGHALVYIKGKNIDGRTQWWIDEFVYPYKPMSQVIASKPIDDGHGHSGAEHQH